MSSLFTPHFDYNPKEVKINDKTITRTGFGGNSTFLGEMTNGGSIWTCKVRIDQDIASSIAVGIVGVDIQNINKYITTCEDSFVYVTDGRIYAKGKRNRKAQGRKCNAGDIITLTYNTNLGKLSYKINQGIQNTIPDQVTFTTAKSYKHAGRFAVSFLSMSKTGDRVRFITQNKDQKKNKPETENKEETKDTNDLKIENGKLKVKIFFSSLSFCFGI